jgi:hypothetical protein
MVEVICHILTSQAKKMCGLSNNVKLTQSHERYLDAYKKILNRTNGVSVRFWVFN